MTHSQAEIVQQALRDLGFGTTPNAVPWPVFCMKEPATPDNCVTTYNTQGTSDGRAMIDGELLDHLGIQIRVRGTDVPTVRAKLQAARTLIAGVYHQTVHVGSSAYFLRNFASIGQILYLGDESPVSKRQIGTLNATLAVDELPL